MRRSVRWSMLWFFRLGGDTMTIDLRYCAPLHVLFALALAGTNWAADEPAATREFEIRNDRAYLGGQQVDLWGLRCGNALHSEAITERHIRNLDNMAAHGINLIGVYVQGSNGGWPDPDAALNGFTRDGKLKPVVAKRLEMLIRAADQRGMVVMVGLLTHRKDQEFYDDAAIQRAIEEAAQFLSQRKLKNVFVDICHEFSHPERMDKELLREPDGEAKKAKLTAWFKAVAPDIEVGVCPDIITNGSAITWVAGSVPSTCPSRPPKATKAAGHVAASLRGANPASERPGHVKCSRLHSERFYPCFDADSRSSNCWS